MYYYIKCNNRGIVYVMICDVMRMMMILFVKSSSILLRSLFSFSFLVSLSWHSPGK